MFLVGLITCLFFSVVGLTFFNSNEVHDTLKTLTPNNLGLVGDYYD